MRAEVLEDAARNRAWAATLRARAHELRAASRELLDHLWRVTHPAPQRSSVADRPGAPRH